jgi:hypothetical protein
MNDQRSYDSALHEIRNIFSFLTEGKPTPDDEIEAKDKLINHFNRLKNSTSYTEEIYFIESILQKLNDWDTLDLWFSETSLPEDIMNILNIPARTETPKEEQINEEKSTGESEIDLTDIFNKVSEQFKGEIETLKGTIDTLKKELDKKDDVVKPPKRKRDVHKITPNPNAKLAPPVIKIPVIKKLVKTPRVMQQSIPKIPLETVNKDNNKFQEQLTPIPVEPEDVQLPVEDHELTPIPAELEDMLLPVKDHKLTPIPKKSSYIETIVIEETKDIPLITERRKVTSVIPEKPKEVPISETFESKPFLAEKPTISAVKIEEIETDSIVSSGSDLFNVFSSVGSKSQEKPQEKPQKIIGFTEKPPKIEEKKKEEKKKKKYKEIQEPTVMPFINFNKSDTSVESDIESPNIENLSEDKDTLYQELIALEGRRYSLERNFKDVEKNFNKGSISEADFKRQNSILKKQLDEITSRINNIRRIISSL